MKTVAISLLITFLAGSVFAAGDVTEPVRDVVEATARNWAEGTTGQVEEVFSSERLARRFSKDFAKAFAAASKNPPYDIPAGETTGFPFDYDPIAQGQDGCPFKNIRIEDDGDGQVTALFDNRSCFDGGAAVDTVLIFHVVEEEGRAVIDDIYPVVEGRSGESIKQALQRQGGL